MPLFRKFVEPVTAEMALPGLAGAVPTAERSFFNDRPPKGRYPEGLEVTRGAL